MKKLFYFLIVTMIVYNSAYGARRLVLSEYFTSTTCAPCASANPYFDNWLRNFAKKDSVVVIKYHTWWPSPGDDPFYWANTGDVQNRNSYYGNNYVPHMYIDGTVDGGSSYTSWPTYINNRFSNVSPFILKISGSFSGGSGSVRIKIISDGTAIPSGTLVLHTVITENGLKYTGPNGDPNHENVMRKMYPGPGGQTFTIALNDSVTITRNISMDPSWKQDNCEIIAFVQIQGTKSVLQAAKRSISTMSSLASPSLVSPPNTTTNLLNTVTLAWNSVSDATSYRMQISTDSLFGTTVLDSSNLLTGFLLITNLNYSTDYYWRVKAANSILESNWTAGWKFSTLSSLSPPVLISPIQDAINLPTITTLSWSSVYGAFFYRLQVSTDSLFVTTFLDSTTLSLCSISVSNLDYDTDYYWRVKASNPQLESGWSEKWKFRTKLSSVLCTLSKGWNLVSVPVVVDDWLKSTIFPSAVSAAFTFNNGYTPRDTLFLFNGYWIKFETSEILEIFGNQVVADSIAVATGWNLIGSISTTVPVSSVTTKPPGLITSDVYSYSSTIGYRTTDMIEPGKAYWIKANQPGKIFLSKVFNKK